MMYIKVTGRRQVSFLRQMFTIILCQALPDRHDEMSREIWQQTIKLKKLLKVKASCDLVYDYDREFTQEQMNVLWQLYLNINTDILHLIDPELFTLECKFRMSSGATPVIFDEFELSTLWNRVIREDETWQDEPLTYEMGQIAAMISETNDEENTVSEEEIIESLSDTNAPGLRHAHDSPAVYTYEQVCHQRIKSKRTEPKDEDRPTPALLEEQCESCGGKLNLEGHCPECEEFD